MRRKRAGALVALALVGGLLTGGTPASANHDATLTIDVGAALSTPKAHSMRFLAPRIINVHKGDQITFNVSGPHTATLLPTNVSAQDWIDENFGLGKEFFYVQPDDEADSYNDAFAKIDDPLDPTCGGTGEPTCKYNGADVVHSGSAFGEQGGDPDAPPPDQVPFTVEINANAGERVWVICLAHPHMRMKINVVDNATAATTQTAIDTAKAAQLALDNEWAESTHNEMKAKRSSHVGADGKRVWDAWAGVDNHWVSILNFYPRKLVLKKGQSVRWHFTELIYEDHTVSLPIPAIFNINFGQPECDSASGPDTPATPSDPNDPFSEPICPEGTTVEFELSGDFLFGLGDGVLRGGGDMESSGVRGANVPSPPFAGNAPYDVKFTRATGDKPMQYLCFLHDMGGKIVVK